MRAGMVVETERTQGERQFEQYLRLQSLPIEHEKQHPGKSKNPDYCIQWRGQPVMFEIKDIEAPPLPTGVGASNSYPQIRERIVRGRKKFKEFKEFCCALVLYNNGAFVMLEHADFMLGSMYGDSGWKIPFDPVKGLMDSSAMVRAFLGGGMMLTPDREPRNTTISALITLTRICPDWQRMLAFRREHPHIPIDDLEDAMRAKNPTFDVNVVVPRVIVWHNCLARIPFPEDLFCGPYDSHVKLVHSHGDTYERRTLYRGSGLPDTIEL
jgi:hypothetical protein